VNSVGVVGSIKRDSKIIEVNPVSFFGVALGFLNLADHTRIHGRTTPFRLSKRVKKARV
jgi:hypothetical protein